MEEELDSSEEGEISNEEGSNGTISPQPHEHMVDLLSTSCFDELDYNESVDESENDDHTHPPPHWELQSRRESEQVAEDADAEEGEIMSDEEGEIKEESSPLGSRLIPTRREIPSHSPSSSPSRLDSKKSHASPPLPSSFPSQWEKSANVCRHFLQGRCSWGDNCRFLHERHPDDAESTPPPRVPHIHHSRSPSEFSPQSHSHHPSHTSHVHSSPHPPHLHPSPRPPNMTVSPFKQRGFGMPPVMNEYARAPPPFVSGGPHFPHHDFPPHAFGQPHPPWPPPPPAFRGQPVPGVGPHKEEENDGWLRLRPIIPGWDSDEDNPSDQRTQLKRKKDLPEAWETESGDDKRNKKKKRKKNKRSKSPAEAVLLPENEWVDPWARKPVKLKCDERVGEDPKGGSYPEEAEEKKKKKKKKGKRSKKDKELAAHEWEDGKVPKKISVPLHSHEQEDATTPENTSPLSGEWIEEKSQQGRRHRQDPPHSSVGQNRDAPPDQEGSICFHEKRTSLMHHPPSSSPPPVRQHRREARTDKERKLGKKHPPFSSEGTLSRQDQLLQALEQVNRTLERKKSKGHHKHS